MLAHGYNNYVATALPLDFYYQDIDGSMFKRDTRILRVIEAKWNREAVTNGQKTQLPIYAAMVEWAVERQMLAQTSGVFIVRAIDDSWDRVTVTRVLPNPDLAYKLSSSVILEGNVARAFQGAREMESTTWKLFEQAAGA